MIEKRRELRDESRETKVERRKLRVERRKDNGGVPTVSPREMLFISKLSILVLQEINNLFCSISFGGERNGTQRKAADGPAQLKINCVPLKE